MEPGTYDIVKSINCGDAAALNPVSRLLVWEESMECTEECVIHDHCKSRSVNLDTGEFNPCLLRQRFSRYISKTLVQCIPKATELDHHKIGVLLMPVYSQLMDYQILLSHYRKDMVKNFRTVESIHRAIRDISKTLMLSLKDISGSGDGPHSKSKALEGDPEYYDNLIKKTTGG